MLTLEDLNDPEGFTEYEEEVFVWALTTWKRASAARKCRGASPSGRR